MEASFGSRNEHWMRPLNMEQKRSWNERMAWAALVFGLLAMGTLMLMLV